MDDDSLDPNALPSATNLRFMLLAATVTLMALWYGNEVQESLHFVNSLNKPLDLRSSFLIVLFVWIIAIGVYLAHPLYCKSRFTEGTGKPPAGLDAEITTACSKIGLRHVSFHIDGNIRNFDAIAYGYPFRRHVLLGKGNLLQFRRRPEDFQAKLHHELSHIKNSDVDIGFLAIGLLFAAATIVVAVSVYWSANFVRFLIHYNQGEILTEQEPLHYLLFEGFPMFIVGLLWVAALWLEHRSFIRAREIMADAAAAHYTNIAAVHRALGQPFAGGTKKSLRNWFRVLVKAHPTTVQRAAIVSNYREAGFPDTKLLFTVGFLFAIIDSISDIIKMNYAADALFYDWECKNPDCLNELLKIAASDSGYLFASIITLFLIDAITLLSVAAILRAALQCRISKRNLSNYIFNCVKISAAMALGYILGDAINPFYLRSLISSGFSQWLPKFSESALYDGVVYSSYLFVVATPMYWIAGLILGGMRKNRVNESLWLLFSGFLMLALGQLIVYFVLIQASLEDLPDTILGHDERLSLSAGFLGGFLLWTILATGVGLVIRGGVSRRTKSAPASEMGPYNA